MIKRVLIDPKIKAIPLWGTLRSLLEDPRFKEATEDKYDILLTSDPEFVKKHPGVPVLVPKDTIVNGPSADTFEQMRLSAGEGIPVQYVLPFKVIDDTLDIISKHEARSEGETLVGLAAQLRWNLQRVDEAEKSSPEREKALHAAYQRFRDLRSGYMSEEGRKFMIPLGIPGKYSETPEGEIFGLQKTDLVIKKIKGGGGLSAIDDARARYEAAKRHKDTAPLRPSIIYPPLHYGEEVWLVSEQIRGRTVSQILSVLGEEKKKEQDPIKGRKIDNVAAEVIDAHIESLLYWIEHESGSSTSPKDIRQSYITRAKESPDLLGRKFTRTRVERLLWEKSIDLLLGDLEIPEKTIVARRDAVWDNGLIHLGENKPPLQNAPYPNRREFVDRLISIPHIGERYSSIDMGAGGDSILMEIAKFRVAPEGEPFESYVTSHVNLVLERAAQIKGFKREDISKATERLIFAYRALRKMGLSLGVFPPRAEAEFSRLRDAGVLEKEATLDQQIERYRDDARWCAVYGWREFSNVAYDMLGMPDLTPDTRETHLQVAITSLHRQLIRKSDIAPNGNVLLLGDDRPARYLSFLERFDGKGVEYQARLKAAAALFVATTLYRFYKEELGDGMKRAIRPR